MNNNFKEISLVLGSGGARGWAHLGVVQYLRQKGIKITSIAGCSIGAFVGAFVAADRFDVLYEIVTELNLKAFFYYFSDFSFSTAGLIDGDKIISKFKDIIPHSNIKDLLIPFATVATDILTGEEVIFTEGDIVTAVRASIAIPGIFTPVKYGKKLLVDGGVVNPLPVNVGRMMASGVPVVAVDLNGFISVDDYKRAGRKVIGKLHHTENRMEDKISVKLNRILKRFNKTTLKTIRYFSRIRRYPGIIDIYIRSIRIIEKQLTEQHLKVYRPDLLIRPEVGDVNAFEFHRIKESIEKGYYAAVKAFEEGCKTSDP